MRGYLQRAGAAYLVLLIVTGITPAYAGDIVVKAGILYTGHGQVITDGMLILRDGRVSQVPEAVYSGMPPGFVAGQ